MSDRLALSNAIEDALVSIAGHGTVAVETSIVRAKAERIAFIDAIHDNVATKDDVQAADIRLRGEIVAVRADLALVQHRLLTRLGGLMIVVGGVLFAALHYWPPSGPG